ncbi:MAG: hypothetical protein ACYTFT_11975, partial [Planctomycetota bacterium]
MALDQRGDVRAGQARADFAAGFAGDRRSWGFSASALASDFAFEGRAALLEAREDPHRSVALGDLGAQKAPKARLAEQVEPLAREGLQQGVIGGLRGEAEEGFVLIAADLAVGELGREDPLAVPPEQIVPDLGVDLVAEQEQRAAPLANERFDLLGFGAAEGDHVGEHQHLDLVEVGFGELAGQDG